MGEPSIIQLFQLLQQLLIPNWSDLIALLPWVLVVLVAALPGVHRVAVAARGGRNRSRVPKPRPAGAPPPGVHMPGPSRWPFVVPIGARSCCFTSPAAARRAAGNTAGPVNLWLFVIGLIVTLVAIGGLAARGDARVALDGGRRPRTGTRGRAPGTDHGPGADHRNGSHSSPWCPRGADHRHPTVAADRRPEPPPGVHMPGPSPWPFFAPIALAVMLLRPDLQRGAAVGGLILGVIAAAGWLLDAGQEYHSTEAVGHAVPTTRDPNRRVAAPARAAVRRGDRDRLAGHARANGDQLDQQPHPGTGLANADRGPGGAPDQRQQRRLIRHQGADRARRPAVRPRVRQQERRRAAQRPHRRFICADDNPL